MANAVNPPSNPFEKYVAGADLPFDDRWKCHLLRRAAFGPTHEWLEKMHDASPAKMVDWLLDYDVSDDPMNDRLEVGWNFPFEQVRDAQTWWVQRMLRSPRPFQERIALFWHNHFATGSSKVERAMPMHNQIELFRKVGQGNFHDILLQTSRDPAMLIWLDGRQNRKGKANENYGREVMELFTLGIGSYSEKDVQELARAFTGWTLKEKDVAFFNKAYFDDGPKTVFGQTGDFNDEDAVRILLQRPQAAPFIAHKFLKEFLHPHPEAAQIAHFASRLIALKWEVKPFLKELFTSRIFFSEWAYRAKIKSPADLCVGAVRAVDGGRAKADFVNKSMTNMGQMLMNPPNVKGWDGEEAWINANTVLLRFNFGLSMATQRSYNGDSAFAEKKDMFADLKQAGVTTVEAIIDHYARILLDGRLAADERAKFVEYMNLDEKNKPKKFEFNERNFATKVRGAIHLMMATPQFQLC